MNEPWLYPGTPVPHSGLLIDGEFLDLDAARDRAGRHLEVDGRAVVVAVGSNASPAAMQRKLSRARVSTVVPFLKASVVGIGVGHSAHFSRPGYVPAAPFVAPASATSVVVSLLDREQLAALDDTEPNYERLSLSSAECGLQLDTGEASDTFDIYVSRWGVVRSEGDEPLPVSSQPDVFAHLRRRSSAFARFSATDDLETVMRRLAEAAQHREELAAALVAEALVAESGLG